MVRFKKLWPYFFFQDCRFVIQDTSVSSSDPNSAGHCLRVWQSAPASLSESSEISAGAGRPAYPSSLIPPVSLIISNLEPKLITGKL